MSVISFLLIVLTVLGIVAGNPNFIYPDDIKIMLKLDKEEC